MLILGIPAYQMESLGAVVYATPLLLMGAFGYAIVIYVGFWIADRLWTAKAARQSHRPQHTH
jgi:hypothetical protein